MSSLTETALQANAENVETALQANAKNVETANNADNCDVNDINTHLECDNKCDTEPNEKEDIVIKETITEKVEKLNLCEHNESLQKSQNISAVILQQTESLQNLFNYNSSSSSDSDSDDGKLTIVMAEAEPKSDSELDSDDDSSDLEKGGERCTPDVIKPINKDLPLIEDATSLVYIDQELSIVIPPIADVSNIEINVEEETFLHMGDICNIIHNLVNVEGFRGCPNYDVDTVLFIEENGVKKPLGAVYDVIGPVSLPIYVIRLKDVTVVQAMNLERGTKVFSAPNSEHTKYVFVAELMKFKGTDASWVGDAELPAEFTTNTSDEESDEEVPILNNRRKRKRSRESYKDYEKKMNKFNIANSQADPLRIQSDRIVTRVDGIPSWFRPFQYNNLANRVNTAESTTTAPPNFGSLIIPDYNPSVPPPFMIHRPFYRDMYSPNINQPSVGSSWPASPSSPVVYNELPSQPYHNPWLS